MIYSSCIITATVFFTNAARYALTILSPLMPRRPNAFRVSTIKGAQVTSA
jgi:hypothetical protein